MLNQIVSLIKYLNSNSKPGQIASSFSIGLILGLMPKDNLLWYILLVFFLFVRFSKAGYIIMLLVGTLIAPTFDYLFDSVGYAVLTFMPFENFFDFLLGIPFVAFTKFNNTVVAGSLICGLIMFIPLYAAVYFLIKIWRKYISPVMNDSKLLKTIYKLPLIGKIAEKL